ncbi:hypothetical protein ACFL23_02950 [Patescibacteria group bacterium]
MENSWFYFFSAELQAAAALAALFSVFVVFKIDKLNGSINSTKELILKVFISIKNNENTPGAEDRDNKKFCDKYNIHKDAYTFEKYTDEHIFKMYKEFWNNRSNFSGVKAQLGNNLLTEESVEVFGNFMKTKRIIIHRLCCNFICFSLIIILSSLFLILPREWRLVNFIYIMLAFIIITIGYSFFSIYSVIKS